MSYSQTYNLQKTDNTMEYKKAVESIWDEQNINGRLDQAPFNVTFLFMYGFGIIGNLLVIAVFRKGYSEPSPYRLFAILLAASDLFSSFGFVFRCFERIVFVFHQVGPVTIYICKATRMMSYSNGLASVFLILALGTDRYRKICTPLQPQMTHSQSRIIGGMSFACGILFNFPTIFLFGQQFYVITELNKTATRCGIPKEIQTSYFPIIFYGSYVVVVSIAIFSIGVMQYKIIQSLIQRAKFQREMKNINNVDNQFRKTDFRNRIAHALISNRNQEIAIALAVITLLMVVSFLSLLTFQTYSAFKGFFIPTSHVSMADDLVNEYLIDIVAVNGVLNPVVYFVLDLKFRKEVKSICRKTKE